jgi:tetratricopeptide (TPR) repeat protein
VERSEGNALFLEELVRHAAEGRDDLPLSVQALVQSRVDKLPAAQRVVLRAAAVFGRVCWTQGVSELVGHDCSEELEALAVAEVLTRQDGSHLAGQLEWVFAHGLVQETAYSALLPEDRAALHLAASEWLLMAGEEDVGAIARHAEAGGDRARAAVLWARAAARAYANGQLLAALEFAERGVACGDDPAIRAQCMLHKAQALTWLGRFEEQLEAAEAAVAFADPGTDLWGEAQRLAGAALREQHGRCADSEARLAWTLEHPFAEHMSLSTRSLLFAERTRALTDLGRAQEGLQVAEIAVQLATEAGEAGTNAMLRALDSRFKAISFLGDFSASIDAARAVAERADVAGDVVLATRARVNLGFVLARVGRFEQGREALERALGDARMLRMMAIEGFALHNLGMAIGRSDDLDEAIEVERMSVRIADEIGLYRLKIAARMYEAQLLTWRGAPGDLGAALASIERARADSGNHPIAYIECTSVLAEVQFARRDFPACLAACEDALTRLAAVGNVEEGEEMLRLTYAEALLASGQDATQALRDAYDCVMQRHSTMSSQQHRDAFLSRLYECRRIVDLAVAHLGVPPPAVLSAPPPPLVPRHSAPPAAMHVDHDDQER